jgi:hypothetical protein
MLEIWRHAGVVLSGIQYEWEMLRNFCNPSASLRNHSPRPNVEKDYSAEGLHRQGTFGILLITSWFAADGSEAYILIKMRG